MKSNCLSPPSRVFPANPVSYSTTANRRYRYDTALAECALARSHALVAGSDRTGDKYSSEWRRSYMAHRVVPVLLVLRHRSATLRTRRAARQRGTAEQTGAGKIRLLRTAPGVLSAQSDLAKPPALRETRWYASAHPSAVPARAMSPLLRKKPRSLLQIVDDAPARAPCTVRPCGHNGDRVCPAQCQPRQR